MCTCVGVLYLCFPVHVEALRQACFLPKESHHRDTKRDRKDSCLIVLVYGRLGLKSDDTSAETRFRFSAKRTSLFNSAGRQFSRLLAVEVRASAIVMLDTSSSEVVWRVLATHTPSASFSFTSPPMRHRVLSHFDWTLPFHRVCFCRQFQRTVYFQGSISLTESLDCWLLEDEDIAFHRKIWNTTPSEKAPRCEQYALENCKSGRCRNLENVRPWTVVCRQTERGRQSACRYYSKTVWSLSAI